MTHLLELKNATKVYKGGTVALDATNAATLRRGAGNELIHWLHTNISAARSGSDWVYHRLAVTISAHTCANRPL